MSITYALGLRGHSEYEKEDNMHTNHEWDEPGTKDTYCIKCGNSFEVLELVADLLDALEDIAKGNASIPDDVLVKGRAATTSYMWTYSQERARKAIAEAKDK